MAGTEVKCAAQLSSWNTCVSSHQASHGPSWDGVKPSDAECDHSISSGTGCGDSFGSVRPHSIVAPGTTTCPKLVAKALSDAYLLALNAVQNAAALAAGDPENDPGRPDAVASIVATNCVVSTSVRNFTAGRLQ